MLDKNTESMLKIASTLTAADLDELRNGSPPAVAEDASRVEETTATTAVATATEEDDKSADEDATRGERERARTRESKVATGCLGKPREAHEWWPVGTELIGRIGAEVFTATVVENPRVKSNRSVLITSGPATGRTCLTPTRAAIEATEAFRQANTLGRGGGITNGWSFWTTKSS
jgi:hypothetical protein